MICSSLFQVRQCTTLLMITIYLTDETFKFDNKTIETVSSVELLCVQLDDKLNFSLHAGNICKSIANQLSALTLF